MSERLSTFLCSFESLKHGDEIVIGCHKEFFYYIYKRTCLSHVAQLQALDCVFLRLHCNEHLIKTDARESFLEEASTAC